MAQRKRGGPITHRSPDRNWVPLLFLGKALVGASRLGGARQGLRCQQRERERDLYNDVRGLISLWMGIGILPSIQYQVYVCVLLVLVESTNKSAGRSERCM